MKHNDKFNDVLPYFGQRTNGIKRPQGKFDIICHGDFEYGFYTSKVDAHNVSKPPSSSCYKTYHSQHSNGCWMIHHNFQTTK